MGLLSLPAMMRAGYDPKLAAGTICAAGTLGQIIPPSTVLIFVGDILQGANQQAQLELGNLAPDPISVGQLFAGAMIPGLVLVGLYLALDPVQVDLRPAARARRSRWSAEQRAGLARPRAEGAAAAAAADPRGAGLDPRRHRHADRIGVGRRGGRDAARRACGCRFEHRILLEVMRTTLNITSMVFVILLGASVFSLVFRGLGGENLVHDALASMPGGVFGAVLAVMAVIFVLGFFLDTFEIIFIVVPIAAPALIKLGVDPIWLGVMIGMNLQTSFLTPPFGFALFYLRGVAGKLLRTADIYRGVLPFVALQVLGMALVWLTPGMATELPRRLFSNQAPAAEAGATTDGPVAPSGSPVADDFSDLLEEPKPGRNPPYRDNFDDLVK